MFSGIEVLESTVAIDYRVAPIAFSTQHSMECMKVQQNNPSFDACSGGRPEWVWDYAKSTGGSVPEASHVKYNQNPFGACLTSLTKDPRAEVDYWVTIANGDEEAMKCRVANHGPIQVSISIYNTSLATYKSGIWDDPNGDCNARKIDHAVYLVGYGSEMSQTGQIIDYWLVQNSWGAEYGITGFFKIKRGVNLCLIATDAMYPVLKTAFPQPLEPIYPLLNCILSGDVFSVSGTYIKSFCADNFGRNYESSRVACLQKGGRLYQFDSIEAEDALLSTADTTWTNNRFAVELFVSGTNANGCNGIYNNNPFGPVSGLINLGRNRV